MAHPTKSESPQLILPFFATPREACETLSQSRQEARQRAAAPPPVPTPPKQALSVPPPAPVLPFDPHSPWHVAKYGPKIYSEVRRREKSTRDMRDESRRQRAAVDRAQFFFNRLIENRFPPVDFSDMEEIPCGPQKGRTNE